MYVLTEAELCKELQGGSICFIILYEIFIQNILGMTAYTYTGCVHFFFCIIRFTTCIIVRFKQIQ